MADLPETRRPETDNEGLGSVHVPPPVAPAAEAASVPEPPPEPDRETDEGASPFEPVAIREAEDEVRVFEVDEPLPGRTNRTSRPGKDTTTPAGRPKQIFIGKRRKKPRPEPKPKRRIVLPGAKKPSKRVRPRSRKVVFRTADTTPSRRPKNSFRSRRYEILESIGSGGMGIVYKARDTLLDMTVAIKILPDHLASDPHAARMFKEEATMVMTLSHEHIVKMHNLDVEGGRMFVVMEYVDGLNLKQILEQDGTLSIDLAVETAQCASAAITYAHERGIIHGDLKPANLMITRDSIFKIVDFGSAGWTQAGSTGSYAEYVMGTPGYMSPEQIRGEDVDERTDIYALALCLYELLEGTSAFPLGRALDELLRISPRAPKRIPDPITLVLARALCPDREDRWPSIADLCTAFVEAARPFCDSD